MSDTAYLQSLFDRVVEHLYKQGRQAMSAAAGGCAYRGDNGLKCAVGCLIADEHYDPRMEGGSPTRRDEYRILDAEVSVTSDFVNTALLKSGVKLDDAVVRLLEQLQVAHDWARCWGKAGPTESLAKRLHRIAETFSLTFSLPATATTTNPADVSTGETLVPNDA